MHVKGRVNGGEEGGGCNAALSIFSKKMYCILLLCVCGCVYVIYEIQNWISVIRNCFEKFYINQAQFQSFYFGYVFFFSIEYIVKVSKLQKRHSQTYFLYKVSNLISHLHLFSN